MQPAGATSVPITPEYNQMPDFAREKLRSIWENYKSGKSCVAEQIATDVILTVVNIFPTKYRHAEGEHPTKLDPLMVKPNFIFDGVQRHPTHLTARYAISFQGLNPSTVSSRTHEKRSISQKTYYAEDLLISPARYNSHYEYNSASDHISPTPEDEAVYNEVPISETFELPEFLKGASKNIIDNFTKVWNDPNIPSEGLREEMIHLLAVSLLSTKELTAYNRYMKERRHCQQQLLLHIRQMSDEARKALNILAYIEPDERFGTVENFSPSIRRELKDFARRRAGKCI
uniref:Uncharacterized protein n=1 Tax=Loa loa TaxID=7209 RepID=A0A1I7W2M2_LOALO